MSAVLRETNSTIYLGVWSNLNQDIVATAVPANRWLLASHSPNGAQSLAAYYGQVKEDKTNFDQFNWIGSSCPLPTPESSPTTEFNHQSAAEALKVQRQIFGDLRPGAEGKIRTCDIGKAVFTSNKKQIKARELDRALSSAFESRALRPSEQINKALSLDTTHDSDWSPTSGDYLTELSEAEQEAIQQEATQYRLELLFRTITDRQRAALLPAAEGKTTREIGAELGISQPTSCQTPQLKHGLLPSQSASTADTSISHHLPWLRLGLFYYLYTRHISR